MTETLFEQFMDHNNWANQRLMETCLQLGDDQLDALPILAAYGTIRQTLTHLVRAQVGYLKLLTRPIEERKQAGFDLSFHELAGALRSSGEELLELVRRDEIPGDRLETTDGYWVDPWVVLIQTLDHAAEHRQQVCAQLSALRLSPPVMDGWTYGEVRNGLIEK